MNTERGVKKVFVLSVMLFLLFTVAPKATQSGNSSGARNFLPMVRSNCAPNGEDRSPELYVVYQEDVLTSSKEDAAFACSHGFPWESDTLIPLILYGKGIREGAMLGKAPSLENITPTLARLLSLDPPEESNGSVLTEALKPLWKKSKKTQVKAPKVALVFTLDQCRADYLTDPQIRDAMEFTLNVLAGEGAYYPEARLSYSGSRTAVSHSVIGTGATPGVNGIVGNNIKLGGDFPLAFNDDPRHSMNMFNLLTPTLADVMDLKKNNDPIVISMSPYARAALGMGRPFQMRAITI